MVTPPIRAIGQVPASMVLGLGDLPAAISFESEAKPIFEKHSVECHTPNILPGKAAESPRLKFVTTDNRDTRMPPKGDRLSAAEGDTGEIGKGLNDYEAIFTERKRVGFDGWISIEDGVDGIEQLRRSAEFLKRKTTQYWG